MKHWKHYDNSSMSIQIKFKKEDCDSNDTDVNGNDNKFVGPESETSQCHGQMTSQENVSENQATFENNMHIKRQDAKKIPPLRISKARFSSVPETNQDNNMTSSLYHHLKASKSTKDQSNFKTDEKCKNIFSDFSMSHFSEMRHARTDISVKIGGNKQREVKDKQLQKYPKLQVSLTLNDNKPEKDLLSIMETGIVHSVTHDNVNGNPQSLSICVCEYDTNDDSYEVKNRSQNVKLTDSDNVLCNSSSEDDQHSGNRIPQLSPIAFRRADNSMLPSPQYSSQPPVLTPISEEFTTRIEDQKDFFKVKTETDTEELSTAGASKQKSSNSLTPVHISAIKKTLKRTTCHALESICAEKLSCDFKDKKVLLHGPHDILPNESEQNVSEAFKSQKLHLKTLHIAIEKIAIDPKANPKELLALSTKTKSITRTRNKNHFRDGNTVRNAVQSNICSVNSKVHKRNSKSKERKVIDVKHFNGNGENNQLGVITESLASVDQTFMHSKVKSSPKQSELILPSQDPELASDINSPSADHAVTGSRVIESPCVSTSATSSTNMDDQNSSTNKGQACCVQRVENPDIEQLSSLKPVSPIQTATHKREHDKLSLAINSVPSNGDLQPCLMGQDSELYYSRLPTPEQSIPTSASCSVVRGLQTDIMRSVLGEHTHDSLEHSSQPTHALCREAVFKPAQSCVVTLDEDSEQPLHATLNPPPIVNTQMYAAFDQDLFLDMNIQDEKQVPSATPGDSTVNPLQHERSSDFQTHDATKRQSSEYDCDGSLKVLRDGLCSEGQPVPSTSQSKYIQAIIRDFKPRPQTLFSPQNYQTTDTTDSVDLPPHVSTVNILSVGADRISPRDESHATLSSNDAFSSTERSPPSQPAVARASTADRISPRDESHATLSSNDAFSSTERSPPSQPAVARASTADRISPRDESRATLSSNDAFSSTERSPPSQPAVARASTADRISPRDESHATLSSNDAFSSTERSPPSQPAVARASTADRISPRDESRATLSSNDAFSSTERSPPSQPAVARASTADARNVRVSASNETTLRMLPANVTTVIASSADALASQTSSSTSHLLPYKVNIPHNSISKTSTKLDPDAVKNMSLHIIHHSGKRKICHPAETTQEAEQLSFAYSAQPTSMTMTSHVNDTSQNAHKSKRNSVISVPNSYLGKVQHSQLHVPSSECIQTRMHSAHQESVPTMLSYSNNQPSWPPVTMDYSNSIETAKHTQSEHMVTQLTSDHVLSKSASLSPYHRESPRMPYTTSSSSINYHGASGGASNSPTVPYTQLLLRSEDQQAPFELTSDSKPHGSLDGFNEAIHIPGSDMANQDRRYLRTSELIQRTNYSPLVQDLSDQEDGIRTLSESIHQDSSSQAKINEAEDSSQTCEFTIEPLDLSLPKEKKHTEMPADLSSEQLESDVAMFAPSVATSMCQANTSVSEYITVSPDVTIDMPINNTSCEVVSSIQTICQNKDLFALDNRSLTLSQNTLVNSLPTTVPSTRLQGFYHRSPLLETALLHNIVPKDSDPHPFNSVVPECLITRPPSSDQRECTRLTNKQTNYKASHLHVSPSASIEPSSSRSSINSAVPFDGHTSLATVIFPPVSQPSQSMLPLLSNTEVTKNMGYNNSITSGQHISAVATSQGQHTSSFTTHQQRANSQSNYYSTAPTSSHNNVFVTMGATSQGQHTSSFTAHQQRANSQSNYYSTAPTSSHNNVFVTMGATSQGQHTSSFTAHQQRANSQSNYYSTAPTSSHNNVFVTMGATSQGQHTSSFTANQQRANSQSNYSSTAPTSRHKNVFVTMGAVASRVAPLPVKDFFTHTPKENTYSALLMAKITNKNKQNSGYQRVSELLRNCESQNSAHRNALEIDNHLHKNLVIDLTDSDDDCKLLPGSSQKYPIQDSAAKHLQVISKYHDSLPLLEIGDSYASRIVSPLKENTGDLHSVDLSICAGDVSKMQNNQKDKTYLQNALFINTSNNHLASVPDCITDVENTEPPHNQEKYVPDTNEPCYENTSIPEGSFHANKCSTPVICPADTPAESTHSNADYSFIINENADKTLGTVNNRAFSSSALDLKMDLPGKERMAKKLRSAMSMRLHPEELTQKTLPLPLASVYKEGAYADAQQSPVRGFEEGIQTSTSISVHDNSTQRAAATLLELSANPIYNPYMISPETSGDFQEKVYQIHPVLSDHESNTWDTTQDGQYNSLGFKSHHSYNVAGTKAHKARSCRRVGRPPKDQCSTSDSDTLVKSSGISSNLVTPTSVDNITSLLTQAAVKDTRLVHSVTPYSFAKVIVRQPNVAYESQTPAVSVRPDSLPGMFNVNYEFPDQSQFVRDFQDRTMAVMGNQSPRDDDVSKSQKGDVLENSRHTTNSSPQFKGSIFASVASKTASDTMVSSTAIKTMTVNTATHLSNGLQVVHNSNIHTFHTNSPSTNITDLESIERSQRDFKCAVTNQQSPNPTVENSIIPASMGSEFFVNSNAVCTQANNCTSDPSRHGRAKKRKYQNHNSQEEAAQSHIIPSAAVPNIGCPLSCLANTLMPAEDLTKQENNISKSSKKKRTSKGTVKKRKNKARNKNSKVLHLQNSNEQGTNKNNRNPQDNQINMWQAKKDTKSERLNFQDDEQTIQYGLQDLQMTEDVGTGSQKSYVPMPSTSDDFTLSDHPLWNTTVASDGMSNMEKMEHQREIEVTSLLALMMCNKYKGQV